MPYGHRGNSIVRYYNESYDNLVLVGGFSKSYSSLAAFLALPTSVKNYLKVAAPPYLYSGPSPTASLATVLAGFRVNEAEGDDIRLALCHKTDRVLTQIRKLGLRTFNTSGYPVIELPLSHADDIDALGRFLFDRGIYVTLAAYPLVPRSQVGFRVQVTAANDDSEIEQLNAVLAEMSERFDMQRAEPVRLKSRGTNGGAHGPVAPAGLPAPVDRHGGLVARRRHLSRRRGVGGLQHLRPPRRSRLHRSGHLATASGAVAAGRGRVRSGLPPHASCSGPTPYAPWHSSASAPWLPPVPPGCGSCAWSGR